ncbi:MAG: response regulator [Burkholderiales bacterium]|nr:response regulator [Burkholderiales bacterium]
MPGQPPSPQEPAREFAEDFVEEHRRKIFIGLSLAGVLLMGPFAVNNFLQDRIVLGFVTCGFVLGLLANAASLYRGRGMAVPPMVIFVGSLFGLATAIYHNGLIGVFWVYPGILLFHFMLPRRQANLLNAALILVTLPLTEMHLGYPVSARVAVTLVALVAFANIFSHIAATQHAREVEQRERLDALVHQLEEQNKALREAFRLREEVERIARHDLKTPLASIATVPRLLRERGALQPRDAELLGTVERAALRVLTMVNLSLDLFRMEEGSYRLRAQAVDLGAVVQTVARELDAHARSKQLRVVQDLPAAPLYAQGEELLCYSTIANLLKNAVEASPDGAEVRVRLWRVSDDNGDAVALDIHNAGQVPPEVADRFFEKYASWGKQGGLGLGAYSARLMARVQRGALRMASGPGGTTLSLRLPLWHAAPPVRVNADREAIPIARMPAEALPPLSVLVVDDDEYNVVVLRSLLPSPPLSVRTAVNGRVAVQMAREARPDAIFMDVEMPVMDGLEAARQIRALQRERGEAPSVIAAFSAHDDEGTRRRCLEAGFDFYLAKPSSREEVFAVLCGQDPARAGPGTRLDDGRVWVEPGLMPLMPEFLSSRRQLAEELSAAVARGQRETVRETAHKLAGSLALYGFRAASSVSRDLEQAADKEDLAVLQERCATLSDLLARAQPVARPAAG